MQPVGNCSDSTSICNALWPHAFLICPHPVPGTQQVLSKCVKLNCESGFHTQLAPTQYFLETQVSEVSRLRPQRKSPSGIWTRWGWWCYSSLVPSAQNWSCVESQLPETPTSKFSQSSSGGQDGQGWQYHPGGLPGAWVQGISKVPVSLTERTTNLISLLQPLLLEVILCRF